MSKHLEVELSKLKKKLLSLSSIVEESVYKAAKAISDRDAILAKSVVEGDHDVDLMEVEVEEDCLKALALYQPVAMDLRFVVATLKINNDLERIGDLAVNIAERVIFLNQEKPVEIPFDFEEMARKTRSMLARALDSLIQYDSLIAQNVCRADDEIDEINRQVYQIIYREIRKDPDRVIPLIHYLSISRHLERIADYATNIAEDVIYMIEGRIVRHKPEEFSTED